MPKPDAASPALLAEVRDDVEALLGDLIAGEVEYEVAAMWAGEQFNEAVRSNEDIDADPVLFETLALLTGLMPRANPVVVKPGTFERMLKRLREPLAPRRKGGRVGR
jgi:hypothetical protein